jgi:uncharacterized protein (DUF2336 family)
VSNMHASLLTEVQDTILSGSPDKRGEMLRRVTDLFLNDADRLADQQIELFDEVLGLLIQKIESKVRAELSARLALVENAPANVVRTLAHDDEIAVARPILTHSVRLRGEDLVGIARTKSQKHLLAISVRRRLDAVVTDVLLDRGDLEVIDSLAENAGAQFSDAGLRTLIKSAESDETLAEKVGRRIDVPAALFDQLLMRASDAVRTRLLSITPPALQGEFLNVLALAADEVKEEVTEPRDIAQTLLNILQMQKSGALNEAALVNFANAHKYEEIVVALGLLCSASLSVVEPLMRSTRNDGVLIPCKAADLSWPTVKLILQNRLANHSMSDRDLERAKSDYNKLSRSTAQRLLRFWQVRTSVSEQERMTEKRARTRRLTLEAGIIEIAQIGARIDCVILDLAKGGACVLVPDGDVIPLAFRLGIPSSGVIHSCSVAWKVGNRIGISFLETAQALRMATGVSSAFANTRH